MEKAVHQHNAFHYSCWGANPVQASSDELEKDRYGFTFVGSDGEQHGAPKGYYTVDVTIPTCIPDGNYVMGWVWFGGTGGTKIERNEPQEPKPWGYFGDYWACSFVRVEGGDPLSASYQPVFQNDMSQYSEEGCMSANNMPGTCASEPCRVDGVYQKPRPFTEGRIPAPLTPDNFGGIKENSLTSPVDASPSNIPARTTPKTMYPSASPSTPVPIPSYTTVLPPNPSSSPIPSISSTPSAVPSMEEALITPLSLTASLPSETLIDPVYTPEMIILQSPAPEMTTGISTETAPLVTSATVTVPISKTDSELRDKASNSAKLRACLCYMVGTRCSRRLASATEDLCSARTSKSEQLDSCAQGCCDYCQQHMKKRMCMSSSVKRMCAERRET
ncbi:hypothetical protein BWQ96_10411 [Gracilariopsis chorda]|uniref:Uncharacterized protein n=1 Tax=Gracilariopsis chorda TaxID=448386 RepID=A0A2V3IFC9_9FLOR|nr:hypothetical protein BWQ96_10411 [Gracilariopsis chorda]|eukprot:PXF39880.1 hypothetical protein BWQ96_10411 [Gracilariopsis chorda]